MNFVKSFSLMLAVAFVCSVSIAQEGQCPSSSECSKSASCSKCPSQASTVATAATATDEKCCPVTTAMKNLPAMTYKVGDKAICCGTHAAEMAKKNEKPVHFVVGEKTFETKQEAYTALVESTESYVNNFVTPKKCEKSGKTSIAGESCGCSVMAGQRAELVKKAISDIKMTYVVDGKKCQCPNEAKSIASKSDAKTTYVVAGKETCCNLEARLNFAKAKYAAAVKAIAATTAKKETVSSS